MSEEEPSKLPTTWTDVAKSLSEGGLPQIIAGPAGKAISRLIAGATDIPAAWLKARAEKINDETAARTTIMKAVAKASADAAIADPQLLDRALSRYVSDLHRKQENREAVAQKTAEHLADSPPAEDTEGPSDDWMNVFEEYAEKASSEELRETWARVLSGEIRKPSSFSLRTLQFISVLDKTTADAVEALLSGLFNGQFVMVDSEASGDSFTQLKVARLAGLIGQLDVDTTFRSQINESGVAIFTLGVEGVVVRGKPGVIFAVECTSVSLIGQELYPVIQPPPSEVAIQRLVTALQGIADVDSIQRGKASKNDDGRIQVVNLATIWERPKPPSEAIEG
ncbi:MULTISPECIES: DUF2806 domain-containing protein [unclassified Rhizobium]|jgi:hypothetical protein|uniref:DUF2806 domain-containing protein n=1 Tax=unclassified Rhizobium TaxID=2613769 RepID=UPI000DD58C60|nr:DUF2806 domain-containing protein [Rhizobium sp. UBA1881]